MALAAGEKSEIQRMNATAIKSRPILFTAPMVRAILDGTKTQTRRIVKLPPGERLDILAGKVTYFADEGKLLSCPYGQPGDQLWVKET